MIMYDTVIPLATLFKDTACRYAAATAAAVAVARYHLRCRALSSSLSHPLYDHQLAVRVVCVSRYVYICAREP